MKKREKIIGAIVVLVLAIIFLIIGYTTTSHKDLTKAEMDAMFVEADSQKSEEKSKSDSNFKYSNSTKSNKGASSTSNKEVSSTKASEVNTSVNKSNLQDIYVEVKGEVAKPDVYKMEEGTIINDLIGIAGGVTANADISQINRAAKLSNNQCIVIPKKGEKLNNNLNTNQMQPQNGQNNGKQQININTATKEELKKLSGIGDSKADKIIKYREEKGGFKTIEEIKKVGGIGEATFNNLKEEITIN